jgi:Xaa-Pro aminopeptidase
MGLTVEQEPLFYCGDELHEWKISRLQQFMKSKELDGLLLLKHDAVRYVTEFYTKGYRPFLDFDYLVLVPADGEPVIGYSMGGEDRRIQMRSKVKDARQLPGLQDWGKKILEIFSDYGISKGRIGFDLLPHFIYRELSEQLPDIDWQDVSGMWSDLTSIKHPLEVKLLEEALNIAQTGLKEAMAALKPGISEIEVSAIGEYAMRKLGSEMNPFIPVVSSGSHAAIWERVASHRKIGSGEMVILDFGCVYKGYTGDFARTTIVGKPSEQQRNLYKAAHESLQQAISAVKPGVLCSEIDRVARKVLEERGYGKYQHPWASGHQLGFGLHGSPAIGRHVDVPLAPGMVINIEPSLYTYDDLSIGGVEIEDTVLVTETGYRKLTQFPYDEILLS